MWRLGGGAGQSVSLWNFGGVAEFSELVPLLFPGTRGADSTEGKAFALHVAVPMAMILIPESHMFS